MAVFPSRDIILVHLRVLRKIVCQVQVASFPLAVPRRSPCVLSDVTKRRDSSVFSLSYSYSRDGQAFFS